MNSSPTTEERVQLLESGNSSCPRCGFPAERAVALQRCPKTLKLESWCQNCNIRWVEVYTISQVIEAQ